MVKKTNIRAGAGTLEMEEKSGPERKNRLAVVSKGLKKLSWDIYLIYF